MNSEALELMEGLRKTLEDCYPGWNFAIQFYALKQGKAEFYFRDPSSLSNLENLCTRIEFEEEKKNGKV